METKNIILVLLEKIKKSKIVRSELIKIAYEKYPNSGFAYYKSQEAKSIRGLTLDIIIAKETIKELTNAN